MDKEMKLLMIAIVFSCILGSFLGHFIGHLTLLLLRATNGQ